MLTHALIAISHVDYCNSILYQVAAVHLRPLQSVMNAAVHLAATKRKWDIITSTLRDALHWILVRQRIDFKIVYKCCHQRVAPYLESMLLQSRQCQHVVMTW